MVKSATPNKGMSGISPSFALDMSPPSPTLITLNGIQFENKNTLPGKVDLTKDQRDRKDSGDFPQSLYSQKINRSPDDLLIASKCVQKSVGEAMCLDSEGNSEQGNLTTNLSQYPVNTNKNLPQEDQKSESDYQKLSVRQNMKRTYGRKGKSVIPHKYHRPALRFTCSHKWSCKKCGKKFSRYHHLWKHLFMYCGISPKFKCSQCSQEFERIYEFHKHRLTHLTDRRDNSSEVESETSTNRCSSHGSDESINPGSCASVENEIHGDDQDVPALNCPVADCGNKFFSKKDQKTHLRSHHRIFGCEYCESVLLSATDLRDHLKKRHGKIDDTEESLNWRPILIKQEVYQGLQSGDSETCSELSDSLPRKSPLDDKIDELQTDVVQPHISNQRSESSTVGETDPEYNTNDESGLKQGMGILETDVNANDQLQSNKKKKCDACKNSFPGFRSYILHKRDCKRATLASPVASRSNGVIDTADSVHSTSRQERTSGLFLESELLAQRKVLSTSREMIVREKECKDCKKTFENSLFLQRHLEQGCKIRQYPYHCEICQQSFSRKTTLQNHIKMRHEETDEESDLILNSESRQQCKICAKVYKSVRSLNKHIAEEHGLDDMSESSIVSSSDNNTGVSGLVSNGRKIIRNQGERGSSYHRVSAEDKDDYLDYVTPYDLMQQPVPKPVRSNHAYPCNECGQRFASSTDLVNHLLWHNEQKAKPVVLKGPRKTGVAQSLLQKIVKCVVCGGGFYERQDMLTHVIKTHTRKGKFVCIDCNRSFDKARDLADHSILHDEDFQKGGYDLNQMPIEVIDDSEPELEPEEDPLALPPLGATTAKKAKKRKNSVTICCPTCQQTFIDSAAFQDHWDECQTSGGELAVRTWKCTSCSQTFSSQSEFNFHRQQHHPHDKKLICQVPGCGCPFVHKQGLIRHMRDFHKMVYK